jgi:2-isopropylmalate synthase
MPLKSLECINRFFLSFREIVPFGARLTKAGCLPAGANFSALSHRNAPLALQGGGNGPIDAFVNALGLDIKLMDYHEHSIGSGANAQAACYVELRLANGPTLFGAGVDSNIVTASFKAVLSALNRQLRSNEQTKAVAASAA